MYKQYILFLLVGLVVGASSATAGRWSETATDPSVAPSPAAIVSDNGLLERITKKSEQLSKEVCRLKLLSLVMTASPENAEKSNEQIQESSSTSQMSSAKGVILDNELLEKINKERERLTIALDKYADIIKTCKREFDLSALDIRISKNQIDKYLIQQKERAKELGKPQNNLLRS